MNARFNRHMSEASIGFDNGFLSEAARKRAIDSLNRAYDIMSSAIRSAILAARDTEEESVNHDAYWNGIADYPHLVKDKHLEVAERYIPGSAATIRNIVALRGAIKSADIIKVERSDSAMKERAEAVVRTISEELERRKTMFVEALELGRMFGGLPVSVNAHWVHGEKGSRWIRHFFYLNGKLTPLNVILAAAQALEDEKVAS